MIGTSKTAQILAAHGGFIRRVAAAVNNPQLRGELEPILKASRDNGWGDLVDRTRRILAGERETRLLAGLDDEDRVIVTAILRGIQDPATLPPADAGPDPAAAAPGLAAIIHAASRGDPAALHTLGEMGQQMQRAGGDLARLAACFRDLLQGERDPERLNRGLGISGEGLLRSILLELGRRGEH